MTSATVSVVLASYNGIKHIGEQLDSIRTQTRPPDEVIISDDISSDGTADFCREYIARYALEDWKVSVNEKNLGAKQNFRYALTKCNGDYVFLCDQDDIWMPEKIQLMTQTMDSHPEIRLLASNLVPLWEGEKGSLHLTHITRDDGSLVQWPLKKSLLTNRRPGCTFCFKHELIDGFKVVDFENDFHDEMLWRYAIVSDSLYVLNKRIIKWRRHDSNETDNAPDKSDITSRIEGTEAKKNLYRTFLDASEELKIPPENQKILADEIDFWERRKHVLSKRSIFRIALFALMNLKYYPTRRNALADIYASIFKRT